jgi:hypothetical protein
MLGSARIAANIVATGSELTAYVPAVTFGYGALFRSTSQDGVAWTSPAEVVGAIDGFVLVQDGLYLMWSETEFDGTSATGPRTKIAFGSSSDGISFTDHGVAFAGSVEVLGPDGGVLDDVEIHHPRVWFDGSQFHLYYTGYAHRAIEDIGFTVSSIGHAVGATPQSFEFVEWIAPATPCSGSGALSSHELVQFVRPACAECEPASVSIVMRTTDCEQVQGTSIIRSQDGSSFSAPVTTDWPDDQGTIITSGADAWLYSADYGDGDSINLQAVMLPGGSELVCE